LFRIERKHVNLAAVRSVQLDSGEETEVGAAGEPLDAAASANYTAQTQAQETISKAEKIAKEKSEKMLEDARDEIAEMMLAAREEAEEARSKAWQEGYAKGTEEGKRSFDEKLAEKMHQDDEMLKRVIHEIYDERERTYSGLEDEVVELALEIVRKIINPAEEAMGGVFESLVRNALRQIAPDGKVMIRVSPLEYERFFSSGNTTIELKKGVTMTASVLRDVSLEDGDCIIDMAEETINAGINTQLKYVKLAFDRTKQYEHN